MATKTTAKKTTTKKAVAKPAPEVEVAETNGQEEVTFGVSHLAEMLSEGREKKITTRELRTLIRKMARDGKGRVEREIIPGNRSRYNWSGPEDAEVVAIIAAFNAGELEADKQEKLQALKDRKAAQRAEKAADEAKTTKTTKKKAKAEVVEEEEEEEELELEDEDEEDEDES